MAASGKPTDHVLHEVQDHESSWVIFERFLDGVEFTMPSITLGGYEFRFTKFMFLELVAAVVIFLIFAPLAKRIQSGELPRGRWWNLFEGLLLFVRNEIVRPNLDDPHAHHDDDVHAHGQHAHDDHAPAHAHSAPAAHASGPPGEHHEGDKYLPFFWTLFLFILVLNLLGLIPFLGSATASIWVTGALAMLSFVMIHGAPIYRQRSVWKYLVSLWPKIDVPVLGPIFSLMIYVIEMFGTVIKAGVLAVRLFANMFAGHMVLGMILFFIYIVGTKDDASLAVWSGVSLASVLGVVGLSLLELFVAFLQAYVFTFLTALFMGMNLYPEH